MKTRVFLLVLILAVLVSLFVIFRDGGARVHSEKKSAPEPAAAAKIDAQRPDAGQPVGGNLPLRAMPKREIGDAIKAIFGSEMQLFGKVVDQDGAALTGADVKIIAADKPFERGSSYQRTTGTDGLFEISGLRGAGVYVEAKNPAYHSGNAARRVLESGALPSRESPVVLTLYRKGIAEPLVNFPAASTEISPKGDPAEYDFRMGRFSPVGQGQLSALVVVESSMDRNFSWRYKITLLGGGLIPRRHEFDFAAPMDGYTDILEGRVDADAPNWRGGFSGDFFVKLPDGRFGRFQMTLGRGRDIFLFMIREIAINPNGGRNLEPMGDRN